MCGVRPKRSGSSEQQAGAGAGAFPLQLHLCSRAGISPCALSSARVGANTTPASSPCALSSARVGANTTPASPPCTLSSAPRAAPTQDVRRLLPPPPRLGRSRAPLPLVAGCLLLLVASAIPVRVCAEDDGLMHTIATSLGADRALGWGNDSSPCIDGWTGVVCNERGRVTAIRARNASLNGTLPGDIALLPWLKELDLRDNFITGQLPTTAFLRLERLRLDSNKFTSVAAGFLSGARSLQVFTISNNSQLEGWDLPNNPRLIGGNLRHYVANNASVNGTLSRFLGYSDDTFTALDTLSLANNRLTGEVPTMFSSQTLTHLDLSGNFLSGPLDFIAKLPELQELRLDRNGFTGPLPDFSGLWSLQVVHLAHNNLTGVVPATLVRLRGLADVTLRDNIFQGPVPVFAGSVQTDVAEAALNGSFCRPKPGPCDSRVESFITIAGALHYPQILAMSWKGNHPCHGWLGVHCDKSGSITGVNLCRLGLNGTIHPAFGDFKSLVALLLAGNNITGVVPRSIAGLPSLRLLDVSNNSLDGTMPRFQSTTTIWAEGNPDLTVAGTGTSQMGVSGFVVAAATVIVVLVFF